MRDVLAEIAPHLAASRDRIEAHAMRGIKRCSCTEGWRIIGHEYDYDSCFDQLKYAQYHRDRLPEFAEPGGVG